MLEQTCNGPGLGYCPMYSGARAAFTPLFKLKPSPSGHSTHRPSVLFCSCPRPGLVYLSPDTLAPAGARAADPRRAAEAAAPGRGPPHPLLHRARLKWTETVAKRETEVAVGAFQWLACPTPLKAIPCNTKVTAAPPGRRPLHPLLPRARLSGKCSHHIRHCVAQLWAPHGVWPRTRIHNESASWVKPSTS